MVYVIILTTVDSLTSVTTNEQVAGVENTIELYQSIRIPFLTRAGVRSLTKSEQVSHFNILKTTALSVLNFIYFTCIIRCKERSKDSKEHRDRDEPTPLNYHKSNKKYLIVALNTLNDFLRSANNRLLARNGSGKLTDLSIRSE